MTVKGFTRWRKALGGVMVVSTLALLFAAPAAAQPPGPNPVLHVDNWTCSDWSISNCGTLNVDPRVSHTLYYTYNGTVSGGVTCTSTPWAYPPNQQFSIVITSSVTWSVSCTDSIGEGFSKTVTIAPQPGIQPPGPVPWLHIGSWSCYDWQTSDCGTVYAAPGTDMYYTVYGNISSSGYQCTETPWGHSPQQHFGYPGQVVTWRVECYDLGWGDSFSKTVTVRPA
jgi:hypothetical protein